MVLIHCVQFFLKMSLIFSFQALQATIAQSVEHVAVNHSVIGSSPIGSVAFKAIGVLALEVCLRLQTIPLLSLNQLRLWYKKANIKQDRANGSSLDSCSRSYRFKSYSCNKHFVLLVTYLFLSYRLP